jgi:hypothetical protein
MEKGGMPKRKRATMTVAPEVERISISSLVVVLGGLTSFALAVARILEAYK